MITKLALKNILERKFRSLLAIFSISIGSGCLLLFLALSQGIETSTFNEIEKQKPLTQITVRPPAEEGSVLNFLSRNKEGQLNSSSIKEIEKIEGIKAIHPEIQFQNFASAQASIFGISLITDTMVFGLPEAFIADDLAPNQNWQATEEPYPVIIPRKILDLYNLTIALPQGLPSLQEEKLLNRQLTLYLNYSSFFPSKDGKKNAIKLKVAGFSDKTNLIGLSLPIELVKSFNQEFANSESETYLELFVETSDPALTTAVAEKIEALGYQTQYFHKNTQHIEEKLGFIRASLITISSIIFLLAFISIISTFIATTKERIKEIGLFRALGATKKQIFQLILTEAGIIGVTGSLFGILLANLSSGFIENSTFSQLQDSSLNQIDLLIISPKLMLFTLLVGVIVSLIAAYPPAYQAARMNPIEALKR